MTLPADGLAVRQVVTNCSGVRDFQRLTGWALKGLSGGDWEDRSGNDLEELFADLSERYGS